MTMKIVKTHEKYMPTITEILNICNYLMKMIEHSKEQIGQSEQNSKIRSYLLWTLIRKC